MYEYKNSFGNGGGIVAVCYIGGIVLHKMRYFGI